MSEKGLRVVLRTALIPVFILACGSSSSTEESSQGTDASRSAGQETPLADQPALVAALLEPRRSSFDEMVEERQIRVLVTYNRTNFFLDGATQRGIVADALREWEKALNAELNLGRRPLQVVPVPVTRDQLIPFLEQGRGDMAVANLTITPERSERVDFSVPGASNVSELVVTGPGSPPIASLDDLAGQQVHVRPSSSYRESLEVLNEQFEARGLEAVEIVAASEYLETEDLLEMVAVGLIPITIADAHLASFWAQVFDKLVVHEEVAVATGRDIAWAIRPDADGLKAHADKFVAANRQGKLLGNMLLKRYLKSTKYVDNALNDESRERLLEVVDLFRKYGDQYDFDYLMIAAQGYQESGLDQSKRSRSGAIGIMQLLQSTASDKSVGIPDIDTVENNIHAGTKYMRYMVEQYFDDPEIDEVNRTLLAFASYNAGPNRIRRLREKAAGMGYDPNVWFRNVEVVVASDVGREPVQYVSNIFKYYTAYSLAAEQIEARRDARGSVD